MIKPNLRDHLVLAWVIWLCVGIRSRPHPGAGVMCGHLAMSLYLWLARLTKNVFFFKRNYSLVEPWLCMYLAYEIKLCTYLGMYGLGLIGEPSN